MEVWSVWNSFFHPTEHRDFTRGECATSQHCQRLRLQSRTCSQSTNCYSLERIMEADQLLFCCVLKEICDSCVWVERTHNKVLWSHLLNEERWSFWIEVSCEVPQSLWFSWKEWSCSTLPRQKSLSFTSVEQAIWKQLSSSEHPFQRVSFWQIPLTRQDSWRFWACVCRKTLVWLLLSKLVFIFKAWSQRNPSQFPL